MKSKLLIVVIACALLGCKKQQDQSLDFKQKIDNIINQFENNKSLSLEGQLQSGKKTIAYLIYEDKNNGIKQYKMTSSLGNDFPMVEEVYKKGNKIFYSKWSGLSPYIKDGKFTDSSKCCAVFENKTYFKSPKKAVILKRKKDLNTLQEFNSKTNHLDNMAFEEEELEQAYKIYDRLLQTIEMIGF